MKLFSWNVNGLRSVFRTTFQDWLKKADPDILCIQEVKAETSELDERHTQLPGYWAGVWAPGAEQPDVWPNGATIAIHYAYGLDHPSAKMSRAAAYLARLEAFPDTRMPPNAVLQSTEFGNFRIATPDKDHPTGIPWIDELLDREGHYIPAVG